MPAKTPSPKPRYRVLVGLDYPPHRRAEPGDVVDDLPGDSLAWLLEDGLVEPVEAKATTKAAAQDGDR